jgi:hypothetical protein
LETWSTTTASAASCSEPTIRDLLAGPPRQFGSALPFRIKRARPQVKHVVCFLRSCGGAEAQNDASRPINSCAMGGTSVEVVAAVRRQKPAINA